MASSLGKIKSIERYVYHPKSKRNKISERIMKEYVNTRNGYSYVQLSKNGRAISHRVHKLILTAFCSPISSIMQINHKNGIKIDNRLENLEWVTQSQNMRHAYDTGLEIAKGLKTICLDTGIVYISAKEAAINNGGKAGEMVSRVCRGERSHYKGKKFAFFSDYVNNTIPKFKGKFTKRSVYCGKF